jgi:hypothetical protein
MPALRRASSLSPPDPSGQVRDPQPPFDPATAGQSRLVPRYLAVAEPAVRGHAISFRADPFREDDALVDVADALIITRDGLITHFGPYDQLSGLRLSQACSPCPE